MKKNTSWKFTDELSVTFQSSVSGVGEFGHSLFQFLEFLSKGFVHMFYIVTTIYLIGHGLRFSRWIVAFFWASENKPTFFFRHIFQGQTKRRPTYQHSSTHSIFHVCICKFVMYFSEKSRFHLKMCYHFFYPFYQDNFLNS